MGPNVPLDHDQAVEAEHEPVQEIIENSNATVVLLPLYEVTDEQPEPQTDVTDPETPQTDLDATQAAKAWEALISRTDIDATKVIVHASDAAKITTDKYSTQSQRAARIAHDAMSKLAELAGIPLHYVTPAAQLQDTYFDAAAYLFSNEKVRIEVEVIKDMLDEGLAPILHTTPVPIAKRYVKLTQYRPEASVALYITKLWAADMYGIDLPYAYQAIQQLTHDPKHKRLPGIRY